VRQTHSSQSRIPHESLFGNGVNTNDTLDDNTDQHECSQLSQYLFSHLGSSGISPEMSFVFNEALERASNPKMPPPKSPIRTPTSPSRTSSMFQGKIKETVITIPGMQNVISSSPNPHKILTTGPSKSSPSTNTLTTDQVLHPAQNAGSQRPILSRSKTATSTPAARSRHSLFPHPTPQPLPDSPTRSRSQNSRPLVTCPTRPTTPKTRLTGRSPLRLCLHHILTVVPAAISETHKRPQTKRELGISHSTGSSGYRNSSQLPMRCVTRGRYRTRLVRKWNAIL
jgi:hypothetical protein